MQKIKKRTNKVYSPEFKIAVVKFLRESSLSYNDVIRRFNIASNQPHNAYQTVKQWERIYLEEGECGFMVERRGRKKIVDSNLSSSNKLVAFVETDLITELQQLRMENEYLKKLNALVLADHLAKNRKHK